MNYVNGKNIRYYEVLSVLSRCPYINCTAYSILLYVHTLFYKSSKNWLKTLKSKLTDEKDFRHEIGKWCEHYI